MSKMQLCATLFLLVVLLLTKGETKPNPNHLRDCNEAECAAAVAQCGASCWCDMPVCECCPECALCLGDLWTGCCDCFDICGTTDIKDTFDDGSLNVTAVSDLVKKIRAHLDDQRVVTEKTDKRVHYTGQLGPVNAVPDNHKWKDALRDDVTRVSVAVVEQDKDDYGMPCELIAYVNCMSFNACVGQCQSVGSEGYVWFQNGCCECYGPIGCDNPSCPPYPLCQNCH